MTDCKMTFGSLTRISDLEQLAFGYEPLERSRWETGDYVVGKVTHASRTGMIELSTGRMTETFPGDLVVGALGVRAATLEAVGSWRAVGDDLQMHAMTAAGLIGKVTSRSCFGQEQIGLAYQGHVVRSLKKVTMKDCVTSVSTGAIDCPVVLIVGTSMSSGKTSSAKVIIRRLKKMGLRVTGAKFTGAGRYRDILAMSDAGADAIFDFVDSGLPSTVCEELVYRDAYDKLSSRIAASNPDVLVAEAGASPIEPYNGQLAVWGLSRLRHCTVLCASDPYAVIGVTKGFGFKADLVAGVATSTTAGVNVVRGLVHAEALNLMDPASHETLDMLMKSTLGLDERISQNIL